MKFVPQIRSFIMYTNIPVVAGVWLCYWETKERLQLPYVAEYGFFLLSATGLVYQLHWLLTPFENNSARLQFNKTYAVGLHALAVAYAFAALWFFYALPKTYQLGCLVPVVLTSIYLAPKLPFRAIHWVRGKVYGKTVVLAVVWLFTTLLLPIWAHRFSFSSFDLNYIFYRFLLFLLVCFFFDYRDRESDRAGGIHSFLVHQPLPYLHWFVVVVLGLALWLNWNMKEDIDTLTFLLQMLPLVLLFAFRHKSFQTQSDSWYYLFLDAMVFLVPLCTWLRTLH
jgi:hypothetical protein